MITKTIPLRHDPLPTLTDQRPKTPVAPLTDHQIADLAIVAGFRLEMFYRLTWTWWVWPEQAEKQAATERLVADGIAELYPLDPPSLARAYRLSGWGQQRAEARYLLTHPQNDREEATPNFYQ